jgi:hypothetical protein
MTQDRRRLYEALFFQGDGILQRGRTYGAAKSEMRPFCACRALGRVLRACQEITVATCLDLLSPSFVVRSLQIAADMRLAGRQNLGGILRQLFPDSP